MIGDVCGRSSQCRLSDRRSGDRRIWAGTAALMVAVLTGYTLSRTTGLPQSTDDIGNWGEPLGIASLFVEGAVVAVSGAALRGVPPHSRFRAVEVTG